MYRLFKHKKFKCGRCHAGETGRPLGVILQKHRGDLKEGNVNKSKLVKHVFEKGHVSDGTQDEVLSFECDPI